MSASFKLVGELVQIGTDENGFCRAIVKLRPEDLKKIERLPMYRPVEIVEVYDPTKPEKP